MSTTKEKPVYDARYCQCKEDCNCIDAQEECYCKACGRIDVQLYESDNGGFYCEDDSTPSKDSFNPRDFLGREYFK